MATRYVSRAQDDGAFSIVDVFTGFTASYAGRALSGIPADMIARGLQTLNLLDAAERDEAAPQPELPSLIGSSSVPQRSRAY